MTGQFPAVVQFVRWRRRKWWGRRRVVVIHRQEVVTADAYIPPLPPECGVLIVYADNTREYFPPDNVS